jgi:hypothetical protein
MAHRRAFVVLPAAYGLLAAWLCEAFLSPGSWFQRLPVPLIVPLGILALVLPEAMILGAVVFLGGLVVTAVPRLLDVWRSQAVTVLGTVVFAAVVVFGLFSLAWDIASIATGRSLDAPPTL